MSDAVLGLYKHVDLLADAAEDLVSAGHEVEVISPIPVDHEIDHILPKKKNPIRYFTLFGGLFGLIFGTLFVLLTTALYPLPRGGRPLFPFTPTFIVSYEFTILFGVLMTFCGFLIMISLKRSKRDLDLPELSTDCFGLLVDNLGGHAVADVEKVLKECGATEVRRL